MIEARWREAFDAADALLSEVYRFPLAKALDPQDPKDFLVISHRLAAAVKGLVGAAEARALREALDVLDVDWSRLSEAARDKVVLAARNVLAKPPPTLPQIGATFQAAGERTIKGTKQSFKEKFGVKIAVDLTQTDARIVAHAAASQALYVRDQYGVRADAIAANARKIVSAGLAQGLGRYELAKDLRTGLQAQGIARSDAYWNMAAGVFVNRSRVYGGLSGYAAAKVTRYKIDAILDEVTTVQCRFMHGKVFEVSAALGRYEAVAASANPEDVKTLQPWMGTSRDKESGALTLHYKDAAGVKQPVARVTDNALGRLDDTGKFADAMSADALAKAGLTSPPYHGNCFPAGTRVSGRFEGGVVAPYNGKLFEVKTRDGRCLTATPKHPVLTSRGFVPVEALREGDELVCYVPRTKINASACPRSFLNDVDDRPACIEEVLCALRKVGPSCRVHRSALDLDGDELRFEGDVDVVGTYGALLADAAEGAFEGFGKRVFKGAALLLARFRRSRALLTRVQSVAAPATRTPRGLELSTYSFRAFAETLPLQTLRIGPAADIDASRYEMTTHARLADALFLCELRERYPHAIALDNVLEIREYVFSHSVYDLRAEGGWFVADGFIVGNCRTTIRPVFGRAPASVAVAPPPPFALTPSRVEPAVLRPPPPAPLPAPPEQAALVFGPGGLKPSPIALYAEQQVLLFGDAPGIVPKPIVIPTAKELLVGALEKILAVQPDFAPGSSAGSLPLDAKGALVLPYKKPHANKVFATKTKKATVQVPLDKLVLPVENVPAQQIIDALKKGEPHAPVVLKSGGKFYLHYAADAPHVLGQTLLASKHIEAKLLDLDALTPEELEPPKKPKKPKPGAAPAASVPPPPVPAAPAKAPSVLPPPSPTLTAAEVMVRAVPGPSGGSNQGQTYEGADGVKRFVKLYKDAGQAHGEHLANCFYKDLGLGAPESVVFAHESGRAGYGSALLAGETLGSAGLTKENAREFMKGFIADVFTGNWDAAGASLDNAFVTKDGRILRIDNGGAFLFRAQGGPKPDAALKSISEWEVFFSPKNESYLRIANAAGYASPEDDAFKADVARQIKDVLALKKKAGGWSAYVESTAPGLAQSERKRMVDMLDARTKLLEDKLDELEAPPKPKPKKGEGYFAPSLNGLPPSDTLRFEDLPEVVPEGFVPGTSRNSVPNKLPSGESLSDHRKRAAASINKATSAEHAAIINFTGCGSTGVREYELALASGEVKGGGHWSGKQSSEAIVGAFKKADPEPGTVYRGLQVDEKTIKGFLSEKGKIGLGIGSTGATTSSTWNVNVAVENFIYGLDEGYSSSSNYKVILKIASKTAIPIETISEYGKTQPQKNNECERLLSRDSRYRIVGCARWKETKRVLVLELEEVD